LSQLKKGALLSYLTIFLTISIGLVLTPFIVKSLGDAEFGLYTLIGAFVGYISLLDFGLNNTIVRFISKYKAEKDKISEENFLAITMLIYGMISIIIIIIGVVLYFNIGTIFAESLAKEELDKANIMFVILVFNLAITLPGGSFNAISSAYEHFVYPRTVNIIRLLLRSALVISLLLYGGDSIGLVLIDTVMNILVVFFNGIYIFKRLNVTIKLHFFKISLIIEIFSYSIWVFVFAIVQMLRWQTGQFILGTTTNTVIVAVFAIGIMLGSFYRSLASTFSALVLPLATKMIVNKNDQKSLNKVMVKYGRIVLSILLLFLAGFIGLGKEFVFLWVGENYLDSWTIALLVMITSTIPLVQGFGNSILEAKNEIKYKSILNLVTTLLGVFLGYFLSQTYGGVGMIFGIVFLYIVYNIFINIFFVKVFNFNVWFFFKNTFPYFLVVFVVTILLAIFLNQLWIESSWAYLLLKVLILSAVYIILTFFIAFNKEEKMMFSNFFNFYLTKK
jgi:O-antigen/teichoic acid export membrane protein